MDILFLQIIQKCDKPEKESIKDNILEQELWAEKYKPKNYLELLSDEVCNIFTIRW